MWENALRPKKGSKRNGWAGLAWLARTLTGAGLLLGFSAVEGQAQRATMQVTVQVVEGNTVATTPPLQASQARAGFTDAGKLTVGSVAPWQLLVTTEATGEERLVRRSSAGEGKTLVQGAPGVAASVSIPEKPGSGVITYVLVTN